MNLETILQNPDEIGSAEYRAIHELLIDAAESPEHALTMLNEVREWAEAMEKRICHVCNLPAAPNAAQAFVRTVARLTPVAEDADPQDSVDTVNSLIGMARDITDPADADASQALQESYNAARADASNARY